MTSGVPAAEPGAGQGGLHRDGSLDRDGEPEIVDRWLDAGGLRLRCLAAGDDGSPLLLLHGGGLDAAALSWGAVIGPLARRRRLLAPDLPGYGLSDPPDRAVSTGFYAAVVRDLLVAAGWSRASVVGLSLGGAVALQLALDRPEVVDRLVLVGSYGLQDRAPWQRTAWLLLRLPGLGRTPYALLRRSRRLTAWTLGALLRDRRALTPELVDAAWAEVRRPAAAGAWVAFQRAEIGWGGLRTTFVPRLGEVRAPTLILHGEADQAVPVAAARRAHAALPGSMLQILPGCGHWLPRDCPGPFLAAVDRFLGDHDG